MLMLRQARARRVVGRASAALCGLILISACPQRRAGRAPACVPIALGQYRVDERIAKQSQLVDAEKLASVLAKELARHPVFCRVDDETKAKPAAYRLSLELGGMSLAADGDGAAIFVAMEAVEPLPAGGLTLRASEAARVAGNAELPAVSRAALAGATAELAAQAALLLVPEEKFSEALSALGESPRLVVAIEIAARRKIAAAVPALTELLGHQQEAVSDRAIGALVAIGDRQAVGPLTNLAKFRDTRTLAKVLDGIAQLGGEEARAYLAFVSQAHSDPDIRDLAQEALARLERSADAP